MKESLTQEELNNQLLIGAIKTKATLVILTELIVKIYAKSAKLNAERVLIETSNQILEVERQLYADLLDA